jgi:Na+/H+-dicarboxylate symporter
VIIAAVFGWSLGAFGPTWLWLDHLTVLVQTAFLSALKMIIVPLVFFSLVMGVLQLRETGGMGRLGGITLTYYLGTTAIAAAIGLTVVVVYQPWTAYPPLADLPSGIEGDLIAVADGTLWTLFDNLLSRILVNPFAALAETNILGILAFALLVGLALAVTLPTESRLPEILSDATRAIYRLAAWIIATLPLGLFAIAYQLADQVQVETMAALGQLAIVVLGATLLHGLVVLPCLVWLLTGIKPWQFLARVAQPMVTALTTSSSAATLPVSLTTAETKLGVRRSTAAFVLPLGATVNMDGTALFEGVAAVFLAYLFGVPLGTTEIVTIFVVAMLASIGAPGIPSGSMAGMQMVMLAVGIPLEAIGLLLLIERPLDTFRTAVNVEGDLAGSLVAERFTTGDTPTVRISSQSSAQADGKPSDPRHG